MPKRTCLGCGAVTTNGSRCEGCQIKRVNRPDTPERTAHKQRTYNTAWRKASKAIRQAWLEQYGPVCPGWATPAHPSTDLVVDHDVGVLCRKCNSRKAATHDRPKAQGWGGTSRDGLSTG